MSSTNYAIAYRSGALTVGDGVTLTVTTGGPGGVTVGPAGVPLGGGATRHAPGTVATLIPQPRGDALFLGWTVNGTPTGWADPLTVTLDADATIAATFVARPTFGDVPVAHSSWEAITQLAARGVIKGYGTNPPTFGPADTLTRGQLAALIVRALDWDTTGVSVASFPDLGGQDPELARAILYLARRGVLKGYADGSFGPDDPLTHYQLVLAISRALVADGRWTRAAADDPNFYPNVALAPEDRLYLATYVRNVGSIPGRPASAAWADWDTPASRAWTAQVLWQALDAAFGRDTTP